MMIELIIVCSSLFIIFLIQSTRKPKGFPNGPPRLPVVGSLPFMVVKKNENEVSSSSFQVFRKLVKEYGKVVGFYLGRERAVLISDYEILRELLRKDEASGRPDLLFNDARIGLELVANRNSTLGIAFSQGQVWKEQRGFIGRKLKDLGFGSKSMDVVINAQVRKAIKVCQDEGPKPTDLSVLLNIAMINSIWGLVTGDELEIDDPKLREFIKHLMNIFRNTNLQTPLAFLLSPKIISLPVLRDIAGVTEQQKLTIDAQVRMKEVLETRLENHVAGANKDLLDVLIDHVQETTDEKSIFFGKLGFASIINIMTDLFIAGTDTSTSSILWLLLLMLHYPEVQEKVQAEIDEVVGRDRLPSLEDRTKLHYTNAVLEEGTRYVGFILVGLPHQSLADIKLKDGSIIPKNTMILTNLYHVMHDPDYWSKPDVFDPHRFLDEAGHFRHDERVVPFGIGKRTCIGKSMAEKNIFLFFVGFLQTFKLKASSEDELPKIGPDDTFPTGQQRAVPPFKVVLEAR